KIVKVVRSAIAMPLAAVGTAFGGKFTAGSFVAAASPVGQETNFIFTSNKWNRFWQKFQLKGNLAINANFAALVTSFAILGAVATSNIHDSALKISATIGLAAVSFIGSYYALEFAKYTRSLVGLSTLIGGMAALAFFEGHYIHLNLAEFFIKGLGFNTLAFFSTFGATQVLAGKLHQNGELSEGRRFPIESFLNLYAGTLRGIALGALAAGMYSKPWFIISDYIGHLNALGIDWAAIAFNKTEVLSWVAQLTVGALVTLPLAIRQWKGNDYIDAGTKELLLPQVKKSFSQQLSGGCVRIVAGLSSLYTPFRSRTARSGLGRYLP
ncbi:MAG: hypothetical protein JWQ35_1046, partial [Bacteriovoracaceae bacterium]|nr:hypothetical protein [Bacteriovoracaceae bacterium]